MSPDDHWVLDVLASLDFSFGTYAVLHFQVGYFISKQFIISCQRKRQSNNKALGWVQCLKCRAEEELVMLLPFSRWGGLWADTSQGQVPQPRELS